MQRSEVDRTRQILGSARRTFSDDTASPASILDVPCGATGLDPDRSPREPVAMSTAQDAPIGRTGIQISGIAHAYGEVAVLNDIDLSVEAGRVLALCGPSGCGKSTLLRLVAGLDEPSKGSISIDGEVLTGPNVCIPPEQRGVGLVFQDGALFEHLTVARNVGFGLPKCWNWSECLRCGTVSRRNYQVGNANGLRWHALWPDRQRRCCSMSHSRASTPSAAVRCEPTCWPCWHSRRRPRSW